jgi:hypothetical protein
MMNQSYTNSERSYVSAAEKENSNRQANMHQKKMSSASSKQMGQRFSDQTNHQVN